LAESQPENWQRLIEILLDKPTCAVNKENLITFDSNAKVEEQFKRFNEQTGLSRRTFFNYRKKALETS
jgi:hypothetical protein